MSSPILTSATPGECSDKVRFAFLSRKNISWGAIIAGFAATLAFQILFILLGAALGLAAYEPVTDANPVASLGKGALLIHGVSAVLSLFLGGWVAGRFTPVTARLTASLHGFIVWTIALLAGVAAVLCGAGWATGALGQAVGHGLSAASKPVLAAAAGAGAVGAKEASKELPGAVDALKSFTDEALSKRAADAPKGSEIRAKRDIALAVGRFFKPGDDRSFEAKKGELIKLVADRSGISESDAEVLVKEWNDTYESIRKDVREATDKAEKKAREVAEDAAGTLAVYSLCAFLAFVMGAAASAFGGCLGAKCATRCEARCGTSCRDEA